MAGLSPVVEGHPAGFYQPRFGNVPGATMSDVKKIEGAKKKAGRAAALATLALLAGKDPATMTKKEHDDYEHAIGLLSGVLDINFKVKGA